MGWIVKGEMAFRTSSVGNDEEATVNIFCLKIFFVYYFPFRVHFFVHLTQCFFFFFCFVHHVKSCPLFVCVDFLFNFLYSSFVRLISELLLVVLRILWRKGPNLKRFPLRRNDCSDKVQGQTTLDLSFFFFLFNLLISFYFLREFGLPANYSYQ